MRDKDSTLSSMDVDSGGIAELKFGGSPPRGINVPNLVSSADLKVPHSHTLSEDQLNSIRSECKDFICMRNSVFAHRELVHFGAARLPTTLGRCTECKRRAVTEAIKTGINDQQLRLAAAEQTKQSEKGSKYGTGRIDFQGYFSQTWTSRRRCTRSCCANSVTACLEVFIIVSREFSA